MKVKKGYLPKITGRPASGLISQEVVSPLQIPLSLAGKQYEPLVNAGQAVKCGQPLAKLDISGGSLNIPAPYAGTVEQIKLEREFLVLNVAEANPQAWAEPTYPDPAVMEDKAARKLLAEAGIWPAFWDSATSGTPTLDAPIPKAIVVKTICTEPFRARGKVVLDNYLEEFMQGLSYLERFSDEFAPTYLILTDIQHPLAQKIKNEVAGLAWVRPIFVPLAYPVSNNQYLWRCLRQDDNNLAKGDSVWFVNCQEVVNIARCLGQGLVPSKRIVTLGGPGYPQSGRGHILTPIGTPLSTLCGDLENFEGLRVLRGGVFVGQELAPANVSVGHLDDGFTFLPEGTKREFLSFVRVGMDRPSYTPAYGSWLRPKKAVQTSTSLRGERRTCIACGYCEEVCPVDIMPHLLWRYLGKDLLEEAQAAGAQICVECGLCSYVCPSKIELAQTIARGIEKIHEELIADSQTQEVSL